MKKIILLLSVFFTLQASAQTYDYYFLEIRATGKAEVELTPEMGANYIDIDTLVVSKRKTDKKGNDVVTGKKYESFSAAFNALSGAGLEFVQFTNLPTFGGATAMLVIDLRQNFVIWRKRK